MRTGAGWYSRVRLDSHALYQEPAAAETNSMLAHMVYFALKDKSPESIQRHIAACNKYLTGHEGVTFFAVGTRVPDLTRPVNDQEFDVGLHVVFADRASHDKYQTHERHVKFIEETRPHWAGARVFDADLTK